jgi:hypothetical protein
VDTLEIVIATVALPIAIGPLAEIVVNGASLAALVEDAEHVEGDPMGRYTPLPPEMVLPALGDLPADAESARVQVLACSCGHGHCSWVTLIMRGNEHTVTWGGIQTSRTGSCEAIGPFRFDREHYDAALASPRMADQPFRAYAS